MQLILPSYLCLCSGSATPEGPRIEAFLTDPLYIHKLQYAVPTNLALTYVPMMMQVLGTRSEYKEWQCISGNYHACVYVLKIMCQCMSIQSNIDYPNIFGQLQSLSI